MKTQSYRAVRCSYSHKSTRVMLPVFSVPGVHVNVPLVIGTRGKEGWKAPILCIHDESRVHGATLLPPSSKKKKLTHQQQSSASTGFWPDELTRKLFVLKNLSIWRFQSSGILRVSIGTTMLRNVGNYSHATASHPRRTERSATLLWEPAISQLSISYITGGFLMAHNDFNCETGHSVLAKGQSSRLQTVRKA